jgi:hypothetical protein
MTREIDMCLKLGLDRKELRAARLSGTYDYGDDWCKIANAICWTDEGRAKLARKLDADPADLEPSDGDTRKAVVVPGRVLNHRLIRCAVEGEAGVKNVWVGQNQLYRCGMEVRVFWKHNGWKANKRPEACE